MGLIAKSWNCGSGGVPNGVKLAISILSAFGFSLSILSLLILLPGRTLVQRILKRPSGTAMLLILQWSSIVPILVILRSVRRHAAKCASHVDHVSTSISMKIDAPWRNMAFTFISLVFTAVMSLRFICVFCNCGRHAELREQRDDHAFRLEALNAALKAADDVPIPLAAAMHPGESYTNADIRDKFWSSAELNQFKANSHSNLTYLTNLKQVSSYSWWRTK